MSPVSRPLADLTGKVCMITGATSGIGEAAATAIAACDPTIFLVARNPQKAEATRERITAETGNDKIEILVGDLASQSEIRRVAAEFLERELPLHLLFNNAGVVMLNRQETVDGLEATFAVNHLGYFLLTNLLLDRMRDSAPARIVNTASGAHAYSGGRLDFDDLQSEKGFSWMKVYAKSKLANILFTRELARRLDGSGVTVNCFHPGFVGSNLAVNNGVLAKLVTLALRPLARSNEKGAETGVHLCLSPEVEGESGLYYYDKKPTWPKSYAQNDEDAARLWDESVRLTGLEN
jgi:NAD(P)-dependent dehydrogenase (short-subunit alcohol dehydrogenase family)